MEAEEISSDAIKTARQNALEISGVIVPGLAGAPQY
jgi:hypothetical protein